MKERISNPFCLFGRLSSVVLVGVALIPAEGTGVPPRPPQDGSSATQSPAATGQPGSAVPRLITYSGTVKDATGKVHTGVTGRCMGSKRVVRPSGWKRRTFN